MAALTPIGSIHRNGFAHVVWFVRLLRLRSPDVFHSQPSVCDPATCFSSRTWLRSPKMILSGAMSAIGGVDSVTHFVCDRAFWFSLARWLRYFDRIQSQALATFLAYASIKSTGCDHTSCFYLKDCLLSAKLFQSILLDTINPIASFRNAGCAYTLWFTHTTFAALSHSDSIACDG